MDSITVLAFGTISQMFLALSLMLLGDIIFSLLVIISTGLFWMALSVHYLEKEDIRKE